MIMGSLIRRRHRAAAGQTRAIRKLSEYTDVQIEEVSLLFTPQLEGPCPVVPVKDILSIYLNSRENRRIANLNAIENPCAACSMLLRRIETDHVAIKRMALATMMEAGIGTLLSDWHPIYSRTLLWTYADEQELISELTEHCGKDQRGVFLSRI